MDYQQTIDYLFSRLPMFSRIGAAAYKADLFNTIRLLDQLGNPHHKFKSIHVAGTNGKGSTSHMLAATFQTAGLKTGLYTSPHLKDFRERIKIDGIMVEEDFVIDFTHRINPLIEEIKPSFFEITVAMAFEYFSKQKVDVAVIEVGLGGRLDSTNVITPALSIITNIGRDHMNILGDTLEKIAFEKAGIIKPGIPVVIGETLPETKRVFEKIALERKAPIVFASEKRWVAEWQNNHNLLEVSVAKNELAQDHKTYQLDLPGMYQLKNVLTVIEAVEQLHAMDWPITQEHLQAALPHVKKLTGLYGRWQVLQQHPTVIADVGHNEDGIKQIVQQLELITYNHLHIVLGFVKDKEVSNVLQMLPKTATYYFTKAQLERALHEDTLQALAATNKLRGHAYSEVNLAIKQALANAAKDDLILICGSVFLVGEVNL